MELVGDPHGIAALKAMHDKDNEYLKFLVKEARSNSDLTAHFTAEDGTKWRLKFDPLSSHLEVSPEPVPGT
ncbi:MAG TPA: hypothetical protein VG389_17100 [Myxococcota bacterium]|jgi:hypothetical protein|nr:hypothetical protein [Myxococcota bacterium]